MYEVDGCGFSGRGGDNRAEHRVIQGGDGGENIDMKEAVLSDLEEDIHVEIEGYFEGDSFVATRVIIEKYI